MKRSAAQPMPGQSNWPTPFPGRVWRRLAAITLVLGLVACDREQARSEQLFVFGTVVEVTTWNVPAGEADAAFAQLQQMFDRMHRDWHAWEPGMLTRVNQAFANGALSFSVTSRRRPHARPLDMQWSLTLGAHLR